MWSDIALVTMKKKKVEQRWRSCSSDRGTDKPTGRGDITHLVVVQVLGQDP